MRFFILAPWSDYKIISVDTDSYSIVVGCDTFLNGMIRLNWLWVLTRDPLVIDSAEWVAMQTTVFGIIASKYPSYDYTTRLRNTV